MQAKTKYMHYLIIPVLLTGIFLIFSSCTSDNNNEKKLSFPDDGVFGAYYALPDKNGWNDALWIIIRDKKLDRAFHQKRSAYGDITEAEDIYSDVYADILSDTPDRNSPGDIPAVLLEKSLKAARDSLPGFHPVPRTVLYQTESFEPDRDGNIYGFSLEIEADVNTKKVKDFQMSVSQPGVPGDDSNLKAVEIERLTGYTRDELIRIIEEAYIALNIRQNVQDFPDVQDFPAFPADNPENEKFRALILRTLPRAVTHMPDENIVAHKDYTAGILDNSSPDSSYNSEAGVVSSHFLATEAGIQILERGGNAADAAVAVAAGLSVVEPWFSSVMGGGTWALYYEADSGRIYSQDGVGPVAARNTAEYYAPLAGREGLHQAVVPGAWGGWIVWLSRFGQLPLDEILKPAIKLAEEGFPASPELVTWLGRGIDEIRKQPHTSAVYLKNGRIPAAGETLTNPDLAETFRKVSAVYKKFEIPFGRRGAMASAADYYYRGPMAEKITAFSDNENGPFELSDFTGFYGRIVDPISIDYKNGITVYQNPPNSQGITMLMALNILKGFDFSIFKSADDPDAVHLITEAIKLAQIDKYYHVGDPDFIDVPTEELLSGSHAAARRNLIKMDDVITWPVPNILPVDPDFTHTSTFQIIDRQGNAVSATTSLGAQFLVIGDTGIHINNRMRMLSVKSGNPNLTVPGKKVRHTSNPYIALLEGKPYILGGNTGIDTQPQGQTQQFIWVTEFGLTPQEAVSRPRFITRGFPAAQWPWRAQNDLILEAGTPAALANALKARGHVIASGGVVGNANMIMIDPDDKSISFGADPRGGVNKGLSIPSGF